MKNNLATEDCNKANQDQKARKYINEVQDFINKEHPDIKLISLNDLKQKHELKFNKQEKKRGWKKLLVYNEFQNEAGKTIIRTTPVIAIIENQNQNQNQKNSNFLAKPSQRIWNNTKAITEAPKSNNKQDIVPIIPQTTTEAPKFENKKEHTLLFLQNQLDDFFLEKPEEAVKEIKEYNVFLNNFAPKIHNREYQPEFGIAVLGKFDGTAIVTELDLSHKRISIPEEFKNEPFITVGQLYFASTPVAAYKFNILPEKFFVKDSSGKEISLFDHYEKYYTGAIVNPSSKIKGSAEEEKRQPFDRKKYIHEHYNSGLSPLSSRWHNDSHIPPSIIDIATKKVPLNCSLDILHHVSRNTKKPINSDKPNTKESPTQFGGFHGSFENLSNTELSETNPYHLVWFIDFNPVKTLEKYHPDEYSNMKNADNKQPKDSNTSHSRF